ncbi:MAG: hypothetical protein V4563_15780, partial [Pseudomonadota bacterium]
MSRWQRVAQWIDAQRFIRWMLNTIRVRVPARANDPVANGSRLVENPTKRVSSREVSGSNPDRDRQFSRGEQVFVVMRPFSPTQGGNCRFLFPQFL